MKSNLCSKNDMAREDSLKKDTFKRDLENLLAVTETSMSTFMAFTRERLLPKTESDSEIEELGRKTAEQLGIDRNVLSHAYDIALWFASHFAPEHDAETDDPSAIADDLIQLELANANSHSQLSKILTGIKTIVQNDLLIDIRKRATYGKCAPRITNLVTSVTFHAVFEKEMKFGDSSSDYKPKCLGVVPVVLVKLETARAEEPPILFECDTRMLAQLRHLLIGVETEITAAKAKLSLSE